LLLNFDLWRDVGSQMEKSSRVQLRFGPYATPCFKYGDSVMDEARGEVRIAGLREGPIPWPLGKRGRASTLVLYADLARAVKRESGKAICEWWGVSYATVTNWRKALGVERTTEGTRIAFQESAKGDAGQKAREAAYPTLRSEKRRLKIAAANRRRKYTKSTVEKIQRALQGRTRSRESIERQLATRRKNDSRSGHDGRLWTAAEDELVRRLPAREVAARTGRTLHSVYRRRRMLGVAKAKKVSE
jgi:hypothetical protein